MGRPIRHHTRSDHGFVLPFVIWILVVLAIFAVGISRSVHSDLRASMAANDWVRARSLIQAGTHWGLLQILNSSGEDRQKPDGSERRFVLGDAIVRVRIADENGKVDLNRAHPDVLMELFGHLGLSRTEAETLFHTLSDWRDNDNDPHPNGAEKEDYVSAGSMFAPRNRPITNIYNVQNLLHMDLVFFEKLLDVATVYSIDGRVNPLTAPEKVLLSLPGMTPEAVEVLLDARFNASYDELTSLMGLVVAQNEYILGDIGPVFSIRTHVTLDSGMEMSRDIVVWATPQEEIPYKILDVRDSKPEPEEEDPRGDDQLDA